MNSSMEACGALITPVLNPNWNKKSSNKTLNKARNSRSCILMLVVKRLAELTLDCEVLGSNPAISKLFLPKCARVVE